jgi:hypothetical protein
MGWVASTHTFLAAVSPQIIFTTGQACDTAPAGTRQRHLRLQLPDGVQAKVLRIVRTRSARLRD